MKQKTFDQVPFGVPLLVMQHRTPSAVYAFKHSLVEVKTAPRSGSSRDSSHYIHCAELKWVSVPGGVGEEEGNFLFEDPPEPPDPEPLEIKDMAARITDSQGVRWARISMGGSWGRVNSTGHPHEGSWRALLARGPLKVDYYSDEGVLTTSERIMRWPRDPAMTTITVTDSRTAR